MNTYFENIKKNFGFGCMRFPMVDGQVDYEATKEMIDTFMEGGFNYFDTAHGYLEGKSEGALRECLTSRYPRQAYVLTNKLSSPHFTKNEEIRPLFDSQLKEGVMMVLSGMATMEMIIDNVSYMKEFEPLTEKNRKLWIRYVKYSVAWG